MKFDLDLPQSSDCQIEVAVGRDADGDGCLSDDESKIAVEWLAEPGSVPLCAGSFDPNVNIPDLHQTRIRITGPSASAFTITTKRVLDVLVLTIR